ncbi:DUF2490 domain-containing protein [Tunicatimonas pelagia]|uniref:DUF2490 domain-containing protein n=1 Tax=Tunicatimonas pelagia TaxID=931531 RepID=UPI002665D883|nr:DUF2490 domain-containing protein [Tunicatimonas pelagia]WKN41144.1 DUF2490 domain-containing protein [Tunicatimonas pelagia]
MKAVIITLSLLMLSLVAQAQTEKQIIQNDHAWISVNNLYQLTNRWGVLSDTHIRRTNFIGAPSFYFIRGGVQYSIKRNLRVAGGYAHLWLASLNEEPWENYLNENRIYQQVSFSHRYPGVNTLFRVRNEQRIFNTRVNGESLNDHYIIHRVRMLLSASIPFREGGRTQFLLADEMHLNFGKKVVFNTFNQNRLTVGIKYRMSPQWSLDTGYMMVFQQRNSGFEYNLNHTFRLFFYGTFDFRKDKSKKLDYVRHSEE